MASTFLDVYLEGALFRLRIHHDRVVLPLIKDWNIAGLTGLSPTASELQEKIMELPAKILRKAEVFEKRVGITYA